MNVFIVHAHPEPQSFNGAMTRRAVAGLTAAGHRVQVSDLHAMRFNPVSDRTNFTGAKDPEYFKQQAEEMWAAEHDGFAPGILAEIDKLRWCDLLVFQCPLWWFGLPAILKGWVDRVFAMGIAYGGGRWYSRGVFTGKRAVLSITTGGPAHLYSRDGLNGYIDSILFPIQHGMLYFTGFSVLPAQIGWSVARLTPEERGACLSAWEARLAGIWEEAPVPFPPLEAYDDRLQLKRG
jgi:NAD(P)H dehydrogenase (quinone)